MGFNCYSDNGSYDVLTTAAWSASTQGERANGYVLASLFTIFLIVGVALNVAVIWCIFYKRLYSEPTFILLLNLSVTNFLLYVTFLPFSIVTGFAGEFIFGSTNSTRCMVCKVGVVLTLLTLMSLHSVVLISVDRFVFIKKPLRYHKLVTVKRTLLAVVVVWLLCLGLSLPPLVGVGNIAYSQALSNCILNIHVERGYTLLLVGEAILPLSLLLLTTVWVVCIAWKQLRKIYRINMASASAAEREQFMERVWSRAKKRKAKLQFHLVRVFGAIIVANFLTWLPVLVLICVGADKEKEEIPLFLKSLAYLSLLFQGIVQPALEASLISDIRLTLFKLLPLSCSSKTCRSRSSLSQSELGLCRSSFSQSELEQGNCQPSLSQSEPEQASPNCQPSLSQSEPEQGLLLQQGCGPNCAMVCNGAMVGSVDGSCFCSVCGILDLCSVALLPPQE